jgi:hypothetical protein
MEKKYKKVETGDKHGASLVITLPELAMPAERLAAGWSPAGRHRPAGPSAKEAK